MSLIVNNLYRVSYSADLFDLIFHAKKEFAVYWKNMLLN